MANLTEDELETIDTKPTRGRVLGLAIIAYAIVACSMWVFLYQFSGLPSFSGNDAGDIEPIVAQSAYLVPEDDFLLTPGQLALANMQPTHTTAELATFLGVNTHITTIYLHPAMLNEVDSQWIQQELKTGRLIVAINTPHSALTAKLGVQASQPDLTLESLASNPIAASALRQRPDDTLLQYTSTFPAFEEMIVTLNSLQ